MILLDVMIPELNGLEVLRRVRQKDDEIRIIMLTARDAVMDKVSGLDSGRHCHGSRSYEAVWGYDYYGDTNTVDVYVRYLRKKLDRGSPSIISSVRGIGYIVKD